jgi:hypothetical protein
MKFTGMELLRFWEAGRRNGLSQRKLAKVIGEDFNSVHGKIFREQSNLRKGDADLKRQPYEPVQMRSAVFDIETMDFVTGGVRQHMICGSILPLDEEYVHTIKLEFSDAGNDKRLIKELTEVLYEFDILIGHNIASFDFNWLNSRIMYHRLPPMEKRWAYYDTYQASRRMAIKAERKSLGFLGDFFRLPGEKTAVLPVAWGMIDSHDEDEFNDAMTDIVYHCEQDVRMNRELFYALWPRDKSMANLPMTKKW